jgi:outer membrane protein OmpA-like peptidoglycan-associated protein
MHAIQDTKLGDAKARITSAVNNGARKNCPNALSQAERDVQNAENVISANRNDNASIDPAVKKANESSQLLVEILSATKRPEGVINEDAAKAMVLQNRKLAAANTELGQVTSEVNAQGAQLKSTAATIKLNHALESARKEFTSDEADVYRQGDKLLIRLKAVNFPVGRADLPDKSLPLLAKVKTIAEELNPAAVVVEGHTDSVGNKQLNKILSQNRADAVRDYLAENGLDKDKINAVGFGYEKPLSSNKSKQGRAENRRVDIVITPGAAKTTSM